MPMPSTTYQQRVLLLLISGTGLLLLYLFTRTNNLSAFPSFIDESQLVNLAERATTLSPLADTGEGRLFSYWVYAPFTPYLRGGVVLARLITALITTFGLACALGVAQRLGGPWAMVWAGLLLIGSPYHLFFGRLALADPVAATGALAALYGAVRLVKHPRLPLALFTGIAAFAAVGAKVSSLPYLILPAVCVLQPPLHSLRGRLPVAFLATGLAVGGTAALWLTLRVFGYEWFGLIGYHNESSALPLIPRLLDHARLTLERTTDYFGAVFPILAGAAVLVLLIRRQWLLCFAIVVPLLALWANERQVTRFLYPSFAILLIGLAVALSLLAHTRIWRVIITGVLLGWSIIVGLPAWLTMQNAPASSALTAADHAEYIASDGSGFGLAEVLAIVDAQGGQRIIGLLANCQSLRYLALGHTVQVACPTLNPNGSNIAELAALLASPYERGTFAILEANPYVPSTAPGTRIATLQPLDGKPMLSLYDLSP